MLTPTTGTAILNKHDIRTDIDLARQSLGLCPQHNILFDELTVREHLIFFCRLKGVNKKEAVEDEINKYVSLLDFNDKIDALSKTLSGGQKRKLSIGIALAGGSNIIMLDEPTSGLDASARRSLWNLLIEEKKGRTILLTTHHMDEADVLGDRIAIMNNGQLQTVGSSFFLKKRFGSGYKLICVKKEGCNANQILKVLKDFVPDAHLDSDAQTEAIFILNEDHLPTFPKMFEKIEKLTKNLKISSFGLSLTTLEEVFMKVGADRPTGNSVPHTENVNFNGFIPTEKVTGFTLLMYQFYAIILKKFHFTRRNFYPIGWLILVTAGLMYVFLVVPIEFDSPYYYDNTVPEDVSLSHFNETETGVANDGSNPNLFENYASLFNDKDVIEEVDNFEDYILQKYRISSQGTYERNLFGLTLNAGTVTAWVQSSRLTYYLQILGINIIHRAILKSVAGKEFDIKLSIKPFNIPAFIEFNAEEGMLLKQDNPEDEVGDSVEDQLSFSAKIVNFLLMFIMFYLLTCYWPSIFIAIKVKERTTRAKLLQFISGANRFVYWTASFIIDYIVLTLTMYIIVGVVALTHRPFFRTVDQLGTVMIIFLAYGFSAIPFIYMASFLFIKYATAEALVSVYGVLCEFICIHAYRGRKSSYDISVLLMKENFRWSHIHRLPAVLLSCLYRRTSKYYLLDNAIFCAFLTGRLLRQNCFISSYTS